MLLFSERSPRIYFCTLLILAGLFTLNCGLGNASEKRQFKISTDLKNKCLQVLREGMHSDEFWPSIHAAEGLTLAGQGAEVREFLTPKLKTEKDDQKRCGLARELVRAGDRPRAAIMLDILAGDDTHGHVHSCESLFKVAEIGDGLAMRNAFNHSKNMTQRLMAAGALARCGSPTAFAFLREKLSSNDADTSRITAWILGRIGNKSDIPRLKQAKKKFDDALVRCYFDNSLAALGDADGLVALTKSLSSSDPAIRTYAATFAGDARATSVAVQLERLITDENFDVRIRSAQSLLVFAQPVAANRLEDISRDVYPASKLHPRNTEGSVVQLKDGSLLFATTEFIGGGSDFSEAGIVAKTSYDGGRTWTGKRVIQKNVGKKNVMSTTLRYLAEPLRPETPLGFFYLVKDDYNDLNAYLRISHDDGKTFADPILITAEPGYHVLNNDRVTLLSSGRLLVPVASTPDVRKVNHFVSYCYFSDDGGKTWRAGKGKVDLAKRGAMEPEVIELADGRVLMITRTQLGYIAASYSKDGGDTWSEPVDWNVKAPEAPSTLRRIPATGDLLLIWNHTYKAGAGHGGKRTPLTAAISSDEGKTWKHFRNLETRTDQTYAYTSLTFDSGRAHLSYWVSNDNKSGQYSTRYRSLPVGWFYKQK